VAGTPDGQNFPHEVTTPRNPGPFHTTTIKELPMFDFFKTLLDARLARMEERGASAVEYGLLIAGIAALIVIAVFALGPIVREAFSDTCDEIVAGNTDIAATCDS
jgi:pilus assembly protein Flp/PilA